MDLHYLCGIVFCFIIFVNGCANKKEIKSLDQFTSINTFLSHPARVTCLHVIDSLHIDGQLDESSWTKTNWSNTFSDIEGGIRLYDNIGIRAKFLMDDQNLYIACQVKDPDIQSQNLQDDTNLASDNAIEIFIDPDGDGHDYVELQFTAGGVFTDILMHYPYWIDKEVNYSYDLDMNVDYAIHIEGTLNQKNDKDQFWNLELAIPFSELEKRNKSLEKNSFYRINIALVDHDKKGKTTYDSWSLMGEVNLHKPDAFGYVFTDGRTEPIFNTKEKSVEKLKSRMWSDYYKLRDCRRLNRQCKIDAVLEGLEVNHDKNYSPSIHITQSEFTIKSVINNGDTLCLDSKAQLSLIKKE